MNLRRILSAFAAVFAFAIPTDAHEWHSHDFDSGQKHLHAFEEVPSRFTRFKTFVESAKAKDRLAMVNPTPQSQNDDVKNKMESAQDHFSHFSSVKTRVERNVLYVESNSLPSHNLMVGIRSWQQQVPLPQPYSGRNAWQIPLKPKLAKKPLSTDDNFFRGAIALAVNGVPIFNALNNRGEDAFLAGELDRWGGHCGRGDDYHYHIAPVHLEEKVGKGNPIAYALDGFPIFGFTEADGTPVGKLDRFNGQFDEDGRYHYHATKKYPYIIGGLRGEVDYRGGQIEPQPKDAPIRPAMRPLRGATITGFQNNDGTRTLTYVIGQKEGSVVYAPIGKDSWQFTLTNPNGKKEQATYQQRPKGDISNGGRRPPPRPRR